MSKRSRTSARSRSSARASRLRSSASLNGAMSRRGTCGRRRARKPGAAASSSATHQLPNGLQAADVAGDRLGRERAPELEQPGSELGRGDRVDGPWITEPADRPDEDHPVPLDRPRRRSFGRLGGAEEVGRGPDSDRQNAPRIKRNPRRAKRVRRTSWGRVRRTSHLRASLEMPSVTLRTTSSGGLNPVRPHRLWCWLARKDSNLRSPDPESVARNQPREPPFERAAGLSRPPNRGESDAHSEMSQMPIPKTERVCCPIWARQF